MTDVMGYGDDFSGVDGDDMDVVGAMTMRRPTSMLRLPAKPGWRQGQVAPGVWGPRQGMEPLPLTGNPVAGFSAAGPNLANLDARPQRAFRAERLLCTVLRTGASATARVICSGIFIGTALQSVELGDFDIELLGNANAFGVRLALQPAAPGILVRLPVHLVGPALVGADTIIVFAMFLGRTIT